MRKIFRATPGMPHTKKYCSGVVPNLAVLCFQTKVKLYITGNLENGKKNSVQKQMFVRVTDRTPWHTPDISLCHATSLTCQSSIPPPPPPPPPCALTTGFWSVLPKILIVFQLSCFDPQRKMNVSQIHVKTVEDAWHITLVVVSIVNVPWDSEGPLVKVSLISVCQILIASTDRGMNRLPFSQ